MFLARIELPEQEKRDEKLEDSMRYILAIKNCVRLVLESESQEDKEFFTY